jgi:hypothetical protein
MPLILVDFPYARTVEVVSRGFGKKVVMSEVLNLDESRESIVHVDQVQFARWQMNKEAADEQRRGVNSGMHSIGASLPDAAAVRLRGTGAVPGVVRPGVSMGRKLQDVDACDRRHEAHVVRWLSSCAVCEAQTSIVDEDGVGRCELHLDGRNLIGGTDLRKTQSDVQSHEPDRRMILGSAPFAWREGHYCHTCQKYLTAGEAKDHNIGRKKPDASESAK